MGSIYIRDSWIVSHRVVNIDNVNYVPGASRNVRLFAASLTHPPFVRAYFFTPSTLGSTSTNLDGNRLLSFLLNLYFVQANHPDNEDNLVGVRLLPLVHPDHGQELERGRGGVHLRQLPA